VAFAETNGPDGGHFGYGATGYGGPGGYGATGQAPNGTAAVRTPHLDGTVKSVSGTVIKITDREGFTRTINTSSATKYSDSLTASPAVGTAISASGKVDADGVSLDATAIAKDNHQGPGPGGPRGGPRPAA
jgi:hypothetical protein